MIDLPALKALLDKANQAGQPHQVGTDLAIMLLENADELIRLAELGEKAETFMREHEKTRSETNESDEEYIERICQFFKGEVSRW